MERLHEEWLPPPLSLMELGVYITEGKKHGSWEREERNRMESSLLGQTAKLENGCKTGSPKPSYNQAAPEQGPPCQPLPPRAITSIWGAVGGNG